MDFDTAGGNQITQSVDALLESLLNLGFFGGFGLSSGSGCGVTSVGDFGGALRGARFFAHTIPPWFPF